MYWMETGAGSASFSDATGVAFGLLVSVADKDIAISSLHCASVDHSAHPYAVEIEIRFSKKQKEVAARDGQ